LVRGPKAENRILSSIKMSVNRRRLESGVNRDYGVAFGMPSPNRLILGPFFGVLAAPGWVAPAKLIEVGPGAVLRAQVDALQAGDELVLRNVDNTRYVALRGLDVLVNGQPTTVVGRAQRGFQGVEAGSTADVLCR
jgi:hypothetical protein